jgi:hypothetical protein
VIRASYCLELCRVIWLGENRFIVLGSPGKGNMVESAVFYRPTQADLDREQAKGNRTRDFKPMVWTQDYQVAGMGGGPIIKQIGSQSKIEIRPVEYQRVFVDGQPVGTIFEKQP